MRLRFCFKTFPTPALSPGMRVTLCAMNSADNRKLGAELARAFYMGDLTFEQFLTRFPESGDPDLNELLDLIEHEPKQGGILGVSTATYQEHMSRVHTLIERLLSAQRNAR
jgi:hypothetical protein